MSLWSAFQSINYAIFAEPTSSTAEAEVTEETEANETKEDITDETQESPTARKTPLSASPNKC